MTEEKKKMIAISKRFGLLEKLDQQPCRIAKALEAKRQENIESGNPHERAFVWMSCDCPRCRPKMMG